MSISRAGTVCFLTALLGSMLALFFLAIDAFFFATEVRVPGPPYGAPPPSIWMWCMFIALGASMLVGIARMVCCVVDTILQTGGK